MLLNNITKNLIKNSNLRLLSSKAGLPEITLGGDKSGYAHYTITERVPKTIRQVIDDIDKTLELHTSDKTFTKQGKLIKEELNSLIDDVLQNRRIPLLKDRLFDKTMWNDYIENHSTFLDSEFMLSETYAYRRMKSAFSRYPIWEHYDYFQRSKLESLETSLTGVENLVEWTNSRQPPKIDQLLQLQLWGNKGDLAFFLNRTEDSMSEWSKLDEETLKSSKKLILDDQSEHIMDIIKSKTVKQLDIVLDNSGLELVNDLILTNYLLEKKLTERVFIHYKSIPWFVSDVTKNDFFYTLNRLQLNEKTKILHDQLMDKIKRKLIVPFTHEFWTLPNYFGDIQTQAPELLTHFNKSNLVIFKGDLNFRKLVHDRKWPATQSFSSIIDEIFPKNFKVASIRTCKSDFVCNLNEDKVIELDKNGREWRWGGEFGMIQFRN